MQHPHTSLIMVKKDVDNSTPGQGLEDKVRTGEGCGQVVDLDLSTHLLVEELELSGELPSTSTNVATQTEGEWPAATAAAAAEHVGKLLAAEQPTRKTRKTKRRSSVDGVDVVFSGAFYRSRRPANTSGGESSLIKTTMDSMSGVVTRLPLPFPGPTVAGTRPFTSYPLAVELARLEMEESELEGEGLGVVVEQLQVKDSLEDVLDDSGLGLVVEEHEEHPEGRLQSLREDLRGEIRGSPPPSIRQDPPSSLPESLREDLSQSLRQELHQGLPSSLRTDLRPGSAGGEAEAARGGQEELHPEEAEAGECGLLRGDLPHHTGSPPGQSPHSHSPLLPTQEGLEGQ